MDNPENIQPAAVASEAAAPAAPKPATAKAPTRKERAGAAQKAAGASTPMIRATGRRKEAIAQVRLVPGLGTILVNQKPYETYFPRETLRLNIRQPLVVTHQLGKQNVLANVVGGGLAGQAGAIRLGIARALLTIDPSLRPLLRSGGLLTRDPRAKERKKYGQKGARKRFQWTKR